MRKFLFILFFSSVAIAKPVPAKITKIPVPGVGQIRLSHENLGEPVGQPERVEVFMTCTKTKKQFRVAVARMCKFEGHDYEEGTKTLTLKMFNGRVVPTTGDVVCDQHEMKTVELADICATSSKAR